jgi:hypothetical protein
MALPGGWDRLLAAHAMRAAGSGDSGDGTSDDSSSRGKGITTKGAH